MPHSERLGINMKTTKRAALKLIDEAFWKLHRACEHKHEWNRYLDLIQDEDTTHRKMFKPDHVECGLTARQSRHLFAVKEIFERFVVGDQERKPWTPEAKDFFHIKHSVFAAVAIADMCGDKIRAEFTLKEMQMWLAFIDYPELNKDPNQKEQEAA